jgi:hypothetical protein
METRRRCDEAGQLNAADETPEIAVAGMSDLGDQIDGAEFSGCAALVEREVAADAALVDDHAIHLGDLTGYIENRTASDVGRVACCRGRLPFSASRVRMDSLSPLRFG